LVWLGDLMKTFHVHVLLALVDDLNELCSWSANEPEYVNDDLTQDDIATALALMSEIKKLCIDFGHERSVRRDCHLGNEIPLPVEGEFTLPSV